MKAASRPHASRSPRAADSVGWCLRSAGQLAGGQHSHDASRARLLESLRSSTAARTGKARARARWRRGIPYLNGVAFRRRFAIRPRWRQAIGLNTVSFGNDVYGEPFGSGVLAITQTIYSPPISTITESDVVFNREPEMGFLSRQHACRPAARSIDLRRVALHEFGHVSASITRTTRTDRHGDHEQSHQQHGCLQTDDINGADPSTVEEAAVGAEEAAATRWRRRDARARITPPTIADRRLQSLHGRNRRHGQLSAAAAIPMVTGCSVTVDHQTGRLASSNAASENPAWTAPVKTVSERRNGLRSDTRAGARPLR